MAGGRGECHANKLIVTLDPRASPGTLFIVRFFVLSLVSLVGCVGDSAIQPQPGKDGGDSKDSSPQPLPDGSQADASCGLPGSACCANDTCTGGAACTQSVCACTNGQVACGATCVNTLSDAKNCGMCGHDCVGGSCTGGVCQATTLVTGQTAVTKLVPTPTRLLWTRASSGQQSGGTFGSDLDGKNVATLLDVGSATCQSLDATATDAYFACAGRIYHCTTASCTPTSIANVVAPNDMVLDTTNSRIYYSVGTNYNQQTGGNVWSMPIAGGASLKLLVTDQPNPTNVAIDGGKVYWLNSGTYKLDIPQKNGGIRKAPFGSNQMETVVDADGSGSDYIGLGVDGTTVFYGAGGAAEIHAVATIGGAPTTFAKTLTKTPVTALVVDATNVYWVENGGGVYRCSKSSCTTPKLLVPNQTLPTALAQDATSVYWANSTGEIRRLAK